jgi:hypothetical protein
MLVKTLTVASLTKTQLNAQGQTLLAYKTVVRFFGALPELEIFVFVQASWHTT